MSNGYETTKLGFDRTQLLKEHERPMFRRMTALNAAQSFYSNNNLEYTPLELKALYNRFLTLITDGDDNFFDNLHKHLEKKKSL
jgi:hypothetical protein